jgi:hypothetical protein
MTMHIRNWNCEGDHCERAIGEVRVYPLGGDNRLILCPACWERQNQLRRTSGRRTVNWGEGEVYHNTWETEPKPERRYAYEIRHATPG